MTKAEQIASQWRERAVARVARDQAGRNFLLATGGLLGNLLTKNERDFYSDGRSLRGPVIPIELTRELATEIRQRYSESPVTQHELAALYRCSPDTINQVVRNKIWVDKSYVPPRRSPARFPAGEDCPQAKLRQQDADEIRRLFRDEITQPKLAARFGVSVATISRIVRNRRWKDPKYTPPSKKDLWKRHHFHAGTRHHLVKLNIPKVKRIRRLYEKGWTLKRIAQRFEVDLSTVHAIARHRSWRHVEDGLGVISRPHGCSLHQRYPSPFADLALQCSNGLCLSSCGTSSSATALCPRWFVQPAKLGLGSNLARVARSISRMAIRHRRKSQRVRPRATSHTVSRNSPTSSAISLVRLRASGGLRKQGTLPT